MRTALRTTTIVALLALLLAACGADDDVVQPADEATPPAEEPADDVAEEPDEEEPEEPADDVAEEPDEEEPEVTEAETTVAVATTDLGDILVNGDGRTLYLFDNDTEGESTCYDDCAANWPPLLVDGEATAVDGADAALLGTTARDDGTTQVTYADAPLYHWAGDEAPGDTEGQGVGDIWWVVAPDGSAVRDAETAAQDDDGNANGRDY